MKKKVVVSIVLFLFLSMVVTPVISFADTQQSKKVEQKREQLRKKINSLSKLERQETNKLSKNQQKLEKNQKALQTSQRQYDQKQNNIKELEKELNSYLVQYNVRQKATAERIRCIYKTKHTLIFDLLVSTDSISQFLDRIYYQNLIIQSDKKKMKELKTEAKNVSYLKRRLEYERRQLSGIMKKIDRENDSIKKIIGQNKAMIDKIQRDKRAYERSERELSRQSENLTTIISHATKDSGITVSGGFLKPVPGRVTSPYGWRIHPIFKSRIFHTGIDYGSPYGTPIKASQSGKVIYSGWYGGYGKVVIIDHGSCGGSPTTSLYAHMSRQKVVVGQTVSRGQEIGLVGTTGYATGPHLHFEIRVNGKHTNPNNFL